MQGAFAGAPPRERALSHGWLRSYVELRAEYFVEPPSEGPFAAPAARIWAERAALLDRLERLPQTLCHLDFHSLNLFDADGETVGIDWAFAGVGAVAEDPSVVVADAVLDLFVDSRHARKLYELVAEEYLAGLADAGRAGDEDDVRLGIALSAVVKHARTAPALLSGRWSAPEAFEQRRRVLVLLEALGLEAPALVRS